MENATKALLIAAAILIAIVVITLGVFVLGKGSTLVKENSDMSDVEITTFNEKFEAYCGSNVRGAQVRQLISAVNQHNRSNTDDPSKQVKLEGSNLGVTDQELGTSVTDYNSKAIAAGYAYDVESTAEDNSGGLISKITITKK